MKSKTNAPYRRERADGRIRIIAHGPPPEPGDQLCRLLTGYSECELVRRILAGEYDGIIGRKEAGA